MDISPLGYLAAAGAGAAAGSINALAGGGTLVSFPALVGVGLPPVTANVTNTVSLLPGYIGGSWAQRNDLGVQLGHARTLAVIGVAGGLTGSLLLLNLPGATFRATVPYLILLSGVLLLIQERVRSLVAGNATPAPDEGPPGVGAVSGAGAVAPEITAPTRSGGRPPVHPALSISMFASAVYGGFFGAGLGIVLLAILGIFRSDSLTRSNALKQALSFVINLVAAVVFLFSGHVNWKLVPVMALSSLAGGVMGGRVAAWIDPGILRRLVVLAAIGVAVTFWVA